MLLCVYPTTTWCFTTLPDYQLLIKEGVFKIGTNLKSIPYLIQYHLLYLR